MRRHLIALLAAMLIGSAMGCRKEEPEKPASPAPPPPATPQPKPTARQDVWFALHLDRMSRTQSAVRPTQILD